MTSMFDSLRELAKECFENSKAHGWHEEVEAAKALDQEREKILVTAHLAIAIDDHLKQLRKDNYVPILAKLALITSEVGEAVEAYRNKHLKPDKCYFADVDFVEVVDLDDNDPTFWSRHKPEGLGSELADIVIRVFDLAGLVGIDISREIERKMQYNKSRPYRHGGKLA